MELNRTMGMQRRFILFELNEVPLRVVHDYAERHPQSAFAKVLEHGRQFDTFTPDEGHLSPWITWPTLHRGVPGREHQIVALGQDVESVDRKFPPVWKLLAAAGRRVGLFGSLHSYPLPDDLDQFDFYVPDTFAGGPETKPAELTAFQSFNLHMVDRSGRNVSSELPVKQAITFLLRSLPIGLRAATLGKIARQVATERIWRHRTARRRTIQSLLAFDLFLGLLQSRKPEAAFFFTNHVASSMHRYWPATFRDDYQITQWDDSWVRRFGGEIDYAMSEADQMLGDLIAYADANPDTIVLVSGSMGQAAVDDPERKLTTEVLLSDAGRFLECLGVDKAWRRRRTMAPTYTLAFDDETGADAFMNGISRLKIAGEAVPSRRLGPNVVEFVLGQHNIPDEDLVVTVGNRSIDPADAGLANIQIEEGVGAAAYHVPEGMLLAYDPRQDFTSRASAEPVSITRIAPTLLALQGVDPPDYMDRPLEDLAKRELELA